MMHINIDELNAVEKQQWDAVRNAFLNNSLGTWAVIAFQGVARVPSLDLDRGNMNGFLKDLRPQCSLIVG